MTATDALDLAELVSNPEAVTGALGSWPSLHDAEIIGLDMRREGEPEITLTIVAIPYNPLGTVPHSLMKIRFISVADVELFDWNNQNVVFSLTGRSKDDRKELRISASYGLAGTFTFREADVVEAKRLT